MSTLSVIIPTLNSQNTLALCLDSLFKQKYSDLELIICDGGSLDQTLLIAKKYHAIILKNSLKTAEAGKALGLKKATGKYVLLLDSDNILPNSNWLDELTKPLYDNPIAIGSETWAFTYRPKAGFIERYSALIGANDPYAWFTHKLDKINYLSNTWPHPELIKEENSQYLTLKLTKNKIIPTIGANGTIFRTNFLKKHSNKDFLFDIDIINQAVNKQDLLFIKTKNSIIHTYCESSVKKFIRKQTRRMLDYYQYQAVRQTSWQTTSTSPDNLLFTLYSILFLPALGTCLYGYFKKPDRAWFFHPLACFLSAWIYISKYIQNKLGLLKYQNRLNWSQ